MQSYEKLKTIYEVIAPHITRSEYNWKDYLTYASQFFKKHSFDNILLAYAQDPTATVLASMTDWNKGGRSVNKGGKGIAVCEYENAKLTLSYLFDITQTNGKEINRTDWQLGNDMKQALTQRLSYAHGLQTNDFFMTLYSLAGEAVGENYETHLKGLTPDKDGHIFSNLPARGFEAQFVDLLTDSVTWFAAKRCGLSDDEITLSDGMATVHHFNTIPLVARLGNAVTTLSRGVLLEVERSIRIENSERSKSHERTDDKPQLHRDRRSAVPESPNIQRERERSAPRQIRQDGPGISANRTPTAFYDFENGWQSNGIDAQRTGRGHREDREHDTANAPVRPDAGHRGHDGENTPLEQPAPDSGGNSGARLGDDTEIIEDTAEREPDGSFSLPEIWYTPINRIPYRKGDRIYSKRNTATITAIDTHEIHYYLENDTFSGRMNFSSDRIQFEHLLDEGTYSKVPMAATQDNETDEENIIDDVPQEQEIDLIGDYNIPDEINEMQGQKDSTFDYVLGVVAEYGEPDQNRTPLATMVEIEDIPRFDEIDTFVPKVIEGGTQLNFFEKPELTPDEVFHKYAPQHLALAMRDVTYANVLKAAFEGITDEQNVRTECNATVERIVMGMIPNNLELFRCYADTKGFKQRLCDYVFEKSYTDNVKAKSALQSVAPQPESKNTVAHRNFRHFNKLFPQIVSGEYRYLSLESDGFEPLSIERLYRNQVSIMHTFVQNGELMRDPDMVIELDAEQQTVQSVSFENSGLGLYQEVYQDDRINTRLQKELNNFLSQWLRNIEDQDFSPVRAVVMQNDEEVEITFDQATSDMVEIVLGEAEEDEKPQIRIIEEAVNAHHGQVDMLMQAVQGELTVGMTEYSVFEDVPHINMIQVLDGFRRQGIATMMVQYLQERFPDKEIEWGMLTEDGAAFHAAVTNTEPNERYNIVVGNIEGLDEQINEYQSIIDSGGILSDSQGEDWNELESLKYEYEQELRTLKPERTFIRKPQIIASDDVLSLVEETVPAVYSGNFRYSDSYNLYPNGEKTKYKNNIEAIRLLKAIESERRPATQEEQIVLARYVGWGGLANAFSDKASGWEKEYQELKLHLDEKEYKEARLSTITAYYTEPELIGHIYSALERFGFKGGSDRKLLDPAMGTGNFFSVLPDSLAGTKLHGIELDGITGRIAKLLYPNANISITGYETARLPDDSFDVIIGNIPFNSIKVRDKRYEEHDNWHIHDYFFGHSLDFVKPGGIIAFITSQATMDRNDNSVRRYIAERAEFIGAVRLPNNAFKQLAGTEVTADIIFLQKRNEQIAISPYDSEIEWLDTEIVRPQYIRYNNYFANHPEMVLGEMRESRRMYNREDGTACIAPDGQDLYAELNRALGRLNAAITSEPDKMIAVEPDDEENVTYEKAPDGTKNYTYLIRDNDIFYCEKNLLIPQKITGMKAERVKGLCEIRTALLDVIGIQSHEEYEADELQAAQVKLNSVYDSFVKKCGAINSKANILAFSDDDQFPLLRSIEDERKDKSGFDKSAIFHKATIHVKKRPTHADAAEEALQISMGLRMKVDLRYMSALTGKEPDALIDELDDLIYLNPHKYYGNILEGWETRDEYLSGYVRDKLLYARQKAAESPDLFTRNVQALESVQPEWLQSGDINVQLGQPWIPLEFYRQFMYDTFKTDRYYRNTGRLSDENIDISYSDFTSTWYISNKGNEPTSVTVNQSFGTERINAYEILEQTLNLQTVTVRDPVVTYDAAGKKQTRYVINPEETMVARSKQSQIKEAFATWLWQDKDRKEALVRLYNETYNVIRPREYDGSQLVFDGMSDEMELRPHQKDFAARVIYSGTGLAAHVVGAGKTASMIAAGMYLKSIGAIKKPVYVVPNPLVSQWASEFYRFYPNANLLVTTPDDFSKQNRNRFVSKIAMNDYDGIIIAHSQFERIPISNERQIAMLEREITQLTYEIDRLKREKGDNWSIKQIAIFQKNMEDRLSRLSADDKKDDLLCFEQLGIDMMFVDEAHFFKNCFVYTKLRNIAGVGSSSSERAFDMFLKCEYLQEINNGKGVVFATGTPVSNSISELFVMQRYLQPQELKRLKVAFFDCWVAQYGEVTSSMEIKPEGSGYRMRQRISRFNNLPELMNSFRLVADIQTSEMLKNLNVPTIEGGKADVIVVESTPYQKQVMASYIGRADAIRDRKVKPEEDNMLKLTMEARLMAIEPRLVYPDAPVDHNTKLYRCAEETYSIWEETQDKRLTQIIFCDSGTPKPFGFDAYNEIKRVLVEKGIPQNEIAFVHDAKTDAQRDAMYEKMKKGEIRIMLGSTSKLGTGTNVQNKLYAIHHLDCPWKPAEIEQRNGRGLRPGNDNKCIRIFQYVTKGTFDAYLWQIQEMKLKFIMQIFTGKSIARSCDEVDEMVLSAAEVKAHATDNPMLLEKMSVDNEVGRLKLLRKHWHNEQDTLSWNIEKHYPNSIARVENNIVQITADMETLKQTAGKDFSIIIDNTRFDERAKAAERLSAILKLHIWEPNEKLSIGSYRGFELIAEQGYFSSVNFIIKGNHSYNGQLGESALGGITRIENEAERIPQHLDEQKRELDSLQKQLADAQTLYGKPFEYEEKLSEYVGRQAEIDTQIQYLELKKNDDVIMDDEPGPNEGKTPTRENDTEVAYELVSASVQA